MNSMGCNANGIIVILRFLFKTTEGNNSKLYTGILQPFMGGSAEKLLCD